MIGSPLFERTVLHIKAPYKETTFEIVAHRVSDSNIYIQSARLNGRPHNESWIEHDEIVKGGVLEFEMGPAPNKNWPARPGID